MLVEEELKEEEGLREGLEGEGLKEREEGLEGEELMEECSMRMGSRRIGLRRRSLRRRRGLRSKRG